MLAMEKFGMEDPFLVLNGDTFFTVDLKAFEGFARDHNTDWCLALFRMSFAGRYKPIEITWRGRITSLNAKESRLVNGGVYRVHPRAVARFESRPGTPVSLEDEILPRAMTSGQRLFGIECFGSFVDIGTPDDYRRASKVLTKEISHT